MAAQYGAWSFGAQHGFARITRWNLERPPERFRITYRLILREKELHFHIGVYNPSKELSFTFNLLLHTYLKVPDVRRCQITGLHGCTFIDKVRWNLLISCYSIVCTKIFFTLYDKTRDGAIYQEGREVVAVNEWTDRIYQHTPQEHIVTNVVSGRKMRIHKYNFPDTVIWNPWVDKAREITDFGDDEFPNMLCVEAGHVSSPVILLPGTAFEASQIMQIIIEGNVSRKTKRNR
uniref:Galactose mutarotase n=1 Tax=Glossina austeni TaxID=7395 RepID=A0A1A9V1P5_GLOAU